MQEYFIHYKLENNVYKLPDAIKKQLLDYGVKITFHSSCSPIIIAFIPDDKVKSVQSIDNVVQVSLNKSEWE